MKRPFRTFLGVDLGGGKGKTTAVARLELSEGGIPQVTDVGTSHDGVPWYDDNLLEFLGAQRDQAVLAVDAPLTLTACVRCQEPVCPGMSACVDPTIVWFRTAGQQLIADAAAEDRDQIAIIPANGKLRDLGPAPPPRHAKPHTTPYTQRATELVLHRQHGIIPRETLGQGMGPLTARAAFLVRALRRSGYQLHENLLEVYPKATIHKLFDARTARQYKREVDTWETRARILESLRGALEFGRTSRMAREDCLRNDHCFDAVMCAYTAYLWARDGWTLPEAHRDIFAVDGWIWAPGLS
jgi:predicted nuclease with RNAse H fold